MPTTLKESGKRGRVEVIFGLVLRGLKSVFNLKDGSMQQKWDLKIKTSPMFRHRALVWTHLSYFQGSFLLLLA